MISDVEIEQELQSIQQGNGQLRGEEFYSEVLKELAELRKAFSGEPDGYVISGSKMFSDRVCKSKGEAESALKSRRDPRSTMHPLYRKPEPPC